MRSIYKIFTYTYKSNIWVYKHTYDIAYHSSELGRVFLTTCNTIIQDCNGIREDAKRKREILIRSRYIIHKVFHTWIPMGSSYCCPKTMWLLTYCFHYISKSNNFISIIRSIIWWSCNFIPYAFLIILPGNYDIVLRDIIVLCR